MSLLGYDTYDPATGNVKTSGGEDVDCWMIDTNHDRTAFFPRLVYLPAYKRGNPNIKNLLKALGKDLDPQAQTTLCGLESQPFPPPPTPQCHSHKNHHPHRGRNDHHPRTPTGLASGAAGERNSLGAPGSHPERKDPALKEPGG